MRVWFYRFRRFFSLLNGRSMLPCELAALWLLMKGRRPGARVLIAPTWSGGWRGKLALRLQACGGGGVQGEIREEGEEGSGSRAERVWERCAPPWSPQHPTLSYPCRRSPP